MENILKKEALPFLKSIFSLKREFTLMLKKEDEILKKNRSLYKECFRINSERIHNQHMMKWQTKVAPVEKKIEISYTQSILCVGSCFAETIGSRLIRAGFSCSVNPYGILFNPVSIAENLFRIIEKKEISPDDLVMQDQLWHSLFHHGSFSKSNQEECLKACNQSLTEDFLFLKKTGFLLITWGTAFVYLTPDGKAAANCHKLPSDFFKKTLYDVEAVVNLYKDLIIRLKAFNPSLRILFTVSPVRHWKDGFRQNQISKSILHLAIYHLQKEFPDVEYFPSYEIVMDELRDYRFYADDMLHISQIAQDYIWERFQDLYFSSDTSSIIKKVEQFRKLQEHRPLNQSKREEHLQKLKEKEKELQKQFPFLTFTLP